MIVDETVALVEVLNAATELGIDVVVSHYDKNSGNYHEQQVLNYIPVINGNRFMMNTRKE